MKNTWVGIVVVAAMLIAPAMANAHGGEDHTVMGTITSMSGKNLTVKTPAGKSVMVMLDTNTKVTRGKTKVDASELKVGDRVVASGPEDKEMVTAETLEIGAPAPAAPVGKR